MLKMSRSVKITVASVALGVLAGSIASAAGLPLWANFDRPDQLVLSILTTMASLYVLDVLAPKED